MDQIMESVLCVQYTEEPRIRHIFNKPLMLERSHPIMPLSKNRSREDECKEKEGKILNAIYYLYLDYFPKNLRIFITMKIEIRLLK